MPQLHLYMSTCDEIFLATSMPMQEEKWLCGACALLCAMACMLTSSQALRNKETHPGMMVVSSSLRDMIRYVVCHRHLMRPPSY